MCYFVGIRPTAAACCRCRCSHRGCSCYCCCCYCRCCFFFARKGIYLPLKPLLSSCHSLPPLVNTPCPFFLFFKMLLYAYRLLLIGKPNDLLVSLLYYPTVVPQMEGRRNRGAEAGQPGGSGDNSSREAKGKAFELSSGGLREGGQGMIGQSCCA